MTVIPDDAKYEEICEKVKKRLRYERLSRLGSLIFLACMVAPLLIAIALSFGKPLEDSSAMALLFFGTFLGVGASALFWRKLKVYYVDDDEWAIYYARPLYINLTKCIREKTKGMKEDYRKETLKYARKLLSCVQERWKVGTFKPIREFENGAVSAFEKNLHYRIIPAIEDGTDELLQKVERIMYNFLFNALNLHIENIRTLNERISAPDIGLPNREPSRIGNIPRLRGFLRARRQHLIAMVSISTVCLAVLYGLLVWGLSKESAVSDTLVLLGILISAYVAIRWSTSR
ncbi:hypothetical protein MUP77_21860 [Candidatus Bathyarchaeota archaeon]|nr:hypothetical protein [Candidatus Bathyarchaeota archaeon]